VLLAILVVGQKCYLRFVSSDKKKKSIKRKRIKSEYDFFSSLLFSSLLFSSSSLLFLYKD